MFIDFEDVKKNSGEKLVSGAAWDDLDTGTNAECACWGSAVWLSQAVAWVTTLTATLLPDPIQCYVWLLKPFLAQDPGIGGTASFRIIPPVLSGHQRVPFWLGHHQQRWGAVANEENTGPSQPSGPNTDRPAGRGEGGVAFGFIAHKFCRPIPKVYGLQGLRP